ncbi:hypothetical protein [Nocardia asteroides]|uniref:hypothetical protein n=1 Tax=Nocardia asteroides TaxID=1824 RepID=UPI001E5F1304|nr:hypothetical protein [Nocardia asteroides]UGT53776.1 hypothetical protein LTT85_24305 [Nocardia asteroides]
MSTNRHKAKYWGLLYGETVKPLPKARCAADAYIASSKAPYPHPDVVYRHDAAEPWRTMHGDAEVATQLEFDWTPA